MSKNVVLKPVCKNCGKEAELDKEKSCENWLKYKTEETCSCGCKDYEYKFVVEKIKNNHK